MMPNIDPRTLKSMMAIGRELIKEENIKKIDGVPYAHAYWVGKPGQS